MHILLPTDVFPPRCGGAGWSAHALALALIARGHALTVLVPRQGAPGLISEQVLGVPTLRYGYRAPSIPFVKNYFRHERLWPVLANEIVRLATDDRRAVFTLPVSRLPPPASSIHNSQFTTHNLSASRVIHAQHVQVAPPSVMAGRRIGVPVVITVRDHWPWDYFATGLHGDRVPYRHQTWAGLATDFGARLGPVRGLLALPAIPYVRAHVRRRQQYLRQADAVIAVSGYIARRLEGIVAPERLHVIPNMVDVTAIAQTIATPPHSVAPGEPYLLYVGKLERNKGAHLLVDIFRELKNQEPRTKNQRTKEPKNQEPRTKNQVHPLTHLSIPPLVICGDGSLRSELERELSALGVRVRFLEWAEHDEVLRLMAHCALLLFPSAWGEPLSRVWLEAAACGAPMLAMPTGGIADVISDGVNGALEPTPQRFAARLATLLADAPQRRALGAAAQRTARQRFSTERVVAQVETLYAALVAR